MATTLGRSRRLASYVPVAYLAAIGGAVAFAKYNIPILDSHGSIIFLGPLMLLAFPWSVAVVIVETDAAFLTVLGVGSAINFALLVWLARRGRSAT